MNKDWLDLLKSNKTAISNHLDNQQALTHSICAVANKGILKVSGLDAEQFLQGQLTCNINEITHSTSFFTAFCNAKGRTITTLLIVKTDDAFLLILPIELIEKVSNKLKMYILRAKVSLDNITDQFSLIGTTLPNPELLSNSPNKAFEVTQTTQIIIKLPSSHYRYLILSPTSHAFEFWTELTKKLDLTPCHSALWDYQDISASLVWLTLLSSEDYIPQMLNIDKLGGISFNKGCYTGQEIIARTHYLGKSKRKLFVGECDATITFNPDLKIITTIDDKSIGAVLALQAYAQKTRMLIVMPPADFTTLDLVLSNNHDKINIIN